MEADRLIVYTEFIISLIPDKFLRVYFGDPMHCKDGSSMWGCLKSLKNKRVHISQFKNLRLLVDLHQGDKYPIGKYMSHLCRFFKNLLGVYNTDLSNLFEIIVEDKGRFKSIRNFYNTGDHQFLNTNLAKVEKILEDLDDTEDKDTSTYATRSSQVKLPIPGGGTPPPQTRPIRASDQRTSSL